MKAAPPGIQVDDVVHQIQQALYNVQPAVLAQGLPPLKKIKLSLQEVHFVKANGEIDYLVATAKGSYEEDQVREVDIVLTKPAPNPVKSLGPTIETDLESAIRSAIKNQRAHYSGSPALDVSEIDVQIGFQVVIDGSVSAGFKLVPLTPTVGLERNVKYADSITVTYSQ